MSVRWFMPPGGSFSEGWDRAVMHEAGYAPSPRTARVKHRQRFTGAPRFVTHVFRTTRGSEPVSVFLTPVPGPQGWIVTVEEVRL
ncbi:MAG: hypothetical protein Q8M19_14110 [Reyranella sp.]|nr:hypothetical protein [Reyranella sp.]